MKIKSIKKVQIESTPVYDVVNSKPYHNFIIKTNSVLNKF